MPAQQGLAVPGQRALAIFLLCLVLWTTNVIPLAATSLLAIALLPLLGVLPTGRAFSYFGNSAVFFLLGVFLLTAALIRTGFSKRLTLLFLVRFDRTPGRLLFGILFGSAFLALLMPEHAVVAMMFPVVLEAARSLDLEPGRSAYGKAMFLSLAWGSVIGGVGTYLGGARAPLAAALLEEAYGIKISFVQWASAAIWIPLIMAPVAYLVVRLAFRVDVESIAPATRLLEQKVADMGRMSAQEKKVALLLAGTILCWIFGSDELGLATISILSAVLLFVLRIVRWNEMEEYVNWGVIVMYGGAIAIGSAMAETDAVTWLIDRSFPLESMAPLMVIAVLALLSNLLTEGISNAAVVAMMVPIGFGIAGSTGISPVAITFAITISAGLAYCLPIGTPPNAIAFSSGYYRIADAARIGVFLNAISVAVFVLIVWLVWPLVGVSL